MTLLMNHSKLQIANALKKADYPAKAAESLGLSIGRLRHACQILGLDVEYQNAVHKSRQCTAARARAVRARTLVSSGKPLPKKQIRSSPLKPNDEEGDFENENSSKKRAVKQPRVVQRLHDAITSVSGEVRPSERVFASDSDELINSFEKNLHKVAAATSTIAPTQTGEALLQRLLAITDILIGEYKKATTVVV